MGIYQYQVLFDPLAAPPITFLRVGAPPEEPAFPLLVPSGISSIIFYLEPADGAARFPSNPVQWYSASGPAIEPAFSPQWFEFHQFDSWHFSLWDFNSAPGPASMAHNFQLSVFYEGFIYSTTDPVIVNEPPMPVG